MVVAYNEKTKFTKNNMLKVKKIEKIIHYNGACSKSSNEKKTA